MLIVYESRVATATRARKWPPTSSPDARARPLVGALRYEAYEAYDAYNPYNAATNERPT